jgi:hypothetical protein
LVRLVFYEPVRRTRGWDIRSENIDMKMLAFLFLLLLTVPTLAQNSWAEFPPDESDLKVIDRAYETVYTDDNEAHFYAVLSQGREQTYLDIYKGLPWKRIHRWPISFQDEPVQLRNRAVLHITPDEEGNTIIFHWDEFAGYAEAAVRLSVTYDRSTGKFTTSWSD